MQIAQDNQCYKDKIKQFNEANGKYIDTHKWNFTPSSFKSIIDHLYKMGYISLQIETIFCTGEHSNEFAVILRNDDTSKQKQ